jgi:flagella synthesis protein FlgN
LTAVGITTCLPSELTSSLRIGEFPCRLLRTKHHHFAALRFPDFQRKLEALTKQKNEVIALLSTFSKQVEQILASEKLSKEQGMDAYFEIATKADIDTSSSYKNWQELVEVSKKCRAINEQNGACLHILNKHSLRVLDVLKGKDPTVTTYNKSGHAKSSHSSSTTISV